MHASKQDNDSFSYEKLLFNYAFQFLFTNSTVSEIKFIIYPAMHIIDTFLAIHPLMQYESYSEDNLQLGDNSS